MRRLRDWQSAAAVAAVGAAAIAWLGPPGVDLAAHVYQRAMFLQHGFQLWDNYWYAGRYSFISYSLVYYPLAAVLGIKLLAVLTAAASAAAFAVLVRPEWPDAGSVWCPSRRWRRSRSPRARSDSSFCSSCCWQPPQ